MNKIREVDWDTLEEKIDDEYRIKYPFVIFTGLKSLYDFFHYDLKAAELPTPKVVERYFDKETNIIEISVYELSKIYKPNNYVKSNEDIHILFNFIEDSNIDIFITLDIRERKYLNVKTMNRSYSLEKNKEALKHLKKLNVDINSIELQELFSKEITFENSVFEQKISDWISQNVDWNYGSLKEIYKFVEKTALGQIVNQDDIYYK